jgi:hypothetical protein
MNRTNPCAGEHRKGCFWDHWQINCDRIAFTNAMRFQHIGEATYFVMQFLIGNVAAVIGIITFKDDRGLIGALWQMTVDAIHRYVGCAISKPLDMDIAGGIGRIFDPRIRLDPINPLAMLGPEPLRIFVRRVLHGFVFGIIHISALSPIARDRIKFIGHWIFLPLAAPQQLLEGCSAT